MKTIKTTTREADKYIASQKNFKASALWGVLINDSMYVVHSYNEPIACWISGKGWYVTTTKFSVTTSKHTGIARRALSDFKEVSSDELKHLMA